MNELVQCQLDEDGQRVLERLVDGRLRERDVVLHPVGLPAQPVFRCELLHDLREESEGPHPALRVSQGRRAGGRSVDLP